MAENDRADAPDRFAHGTGHTETHEAEKDGFRPGVTGGGSSTSGGIGAGVAGPGPQSIESTTAALGDMEPSAGTGEGGAGRGETAGDKS